MCLLLSVTQHSHLSPASLIYCLSLPRGTRNTHGPVSFRIHSLYLHDKKETLSFPLPCVDSLCPSASRRDVRPCRWMGSPWRVCQLVQVIREKCGQLSTERNHEIWDKSPWSSVSTSCVWSLHSTKFQLFFKLTVEGWSWWADSIKKIKRWEGAD